MSKTNILNKISNLPDYYKLLNVPDNATMEQITRAYQAINENYENLKNKHQGLEKQIEGEFSIYQKAYKILKTIHEKDKTDLQLRILELSNKEEKLKQEKAEKETANQAETTGTENITDDNSEPSVFKFSQFKLVVLDKEQLNIIIGEKELEKKRNNEMLNEAKKLFQKGKYDHSIDILLKLIEINPHESTYRSYFGLALLKTGLENLALEEFQLALKLNSSDPVALKYFEEKKSNTNTSTLSGFATNRTNLIGTIKELLFKVGKVNVVRFIS